MWGVLSWGGLASFYLIRLCTIVTICFTLHSMSRQLSFRHVIFVLKDILFLSFFSSRYSLSSTFAMVKSNSKIIGTEIL